MGVARVLESLTDGYKSFLNHFPSKVEPWTHTPSDDARKGQGHPGEAVSLSVKPKEVPASHSEAAPVLGGPGL